MDNGISREEHEEFCRRMDDEHKRINHRISVQYRLSSDGACPAKENRSRFSKRRGISVRKRK